MRKLLLFALSMGLGTMSFAQDGKISIDAILVPTGTVTTQAPNSGTNIIKVKITNNETSYVYPATISNFNFKVSLDGNFIDNPTVPGNKEFVIPILAPFAPGQTIEVILATTWSPQGDPGTHTMCVRLERMVVASVPPVVVTNVDQNLESCKDFTFAWPNGILNLNGTITSKVIANNDIMTVNVTGNINQAQIQIMSITGQVVKTVNASTGNNEIIQVIDISDLTSGVYIVTVQTESGPAPAQKVFIQ